MHRLLGEEGQDRRAHVAAAGAPAGAEWPAEAAEACRPCMPRRDLRWPWRPEPLAGHEPDLELGVLPVATTVAAAVGDWIGD